MDAASAAPRARDFAVLPIPPACRHDPRRPFPFSTLQLVLFGLISTFIANLYYCQPILVQLAGYFHVSRASVSNIPTLVQAGYATGLLFISPLGDLVRRRQLLLILMTLSASLTVGLAITDSLVTFEVLCFFVGAFSVTPQVLIPLAADLAPPERRASAISIVFAGLLMGVLLARVLAGIITEFSSYHNVYWMGVGGQYALLVALYFSCPDTPCKTDDLNYFKILYSMAKYAVTEPILIQACLIMLASSATFSSFWVTSTFLLSDSPYHYNTLDIGLFALVGMAGVAVSPLAGRLIDGLVPWMATLICTMTVILAEVIQAIAGRKNIAVPIIAAFLLDVGRQSQQVSLTTVVFGIDPPARSRLNAVLIFSIFLGQVMGTSVGTKVYLEHGNHIAAAVCVAWGVWQLFVLLARGPHVPRKQWIGWTGGMELRRSVLEKRQCRSPVGETAPADEEKQDAGEVRQEPARTGESVP
ncbi:hypothetical protein BOTBODRAFT_108788 [Botryobasidium botryosum FD-172 SS1]|uniref:Major facilitator superfamily (MFS) profile domain-containing protein n=1 Tax=Botryobasidium botryosum (strain FD-172 SS1) TaxID=930990 RepID=A0A067MKW9_BOTB1|nr:hypothetical protein BOTBODRAFT_108788 [Botryobasidium botryosum FD-172 SS1]